MFPILALIVIITVILIIALFSTVVSELMKKRKLSKLNIISIILLGVALCNIFLFFIEVPTFVAQIIMSSLIVSLVGSIILVCKKSNRIGVLALLIVIMIFLFFCAAFFIAVI
jgi:hypothetical protein